MSEVINKLQSNDDLHNSGQAAPYHRPPSVDGDEFAEPVQCGVGNCAPTAMQACASIGPFTANISGLFFINVAFFTYLLGTIRTLEKRFDLSSTESSVMLVIMDLMFAFLSLVIGYLGQRAHKPRTMVICQVLTSVGIFILALPIGLYGPKRHEIERAWTGAPLLTMPSEAAIQKMMGLCTGTPGISNSSQVQPSIQPSDSCQDIEDSQQSVESRHGYVLMLFGSLLIGLGGVAVSTLGIPYIDENVASSDSACYIGIATSAFSWAPIVGLLLAAMCTKLPESIFDETGLKPSHPGYIGAWWLGLLILGVLSITVAMPMFLFPKHLHHYYTKSSSQSHPQRQQLTKDNFITTIKNIPEQTMRFLKNAPYVTLLLSKICGLYGVTGVVLQLPRYLEIHYRQPAYVAGIIAALSGGIVGALGTILGGLVVRRLKLETRGIALIFTLATGFGMLGTALCMLYSCPQTELDGSWDAAKKLLDVTSMCSTGCECSGSTFIPVCTEDRRTFFSPCHAGCTSILLNNNTYKDCSCAGTVEATGGFCPEDTCQTIVPYVITIVIISFLVAFGRVPATVLMLRLVDEKDKVPVMGLTSFFVNILCFVPAPLLFGALFDSACTIWTSPCNNTGACLFYDIRKFRLLMHGVTLCFQVPSLIFAGLTLYLVRNIKLNTKNKPKEALALSPPSDALLEQKANVTENDYQ